MANKSVQEHYKYLHFSATVVVKQSQGMLGGVLVSSATGASIAVYDGIDTAGVLILDTMSVTAGQPYPLPCKFYSGLYIVVSGTISATVFYE